MRRQSLSEVINKILDFNKARGWDPEPGDTAKSVVIEAAELLEHFQWDGSGESLGINPDKKDWQEIGYEVADVFWYLVTFCNKTGLSLSDCVARKLKKLEKSILRQSLMASTMTRSIVKENNYTELKSNTGLFVRIRAIVKMIPEGKVAAYGSIAIAAGIDDARKVGYALHGNQDPKIPCHRVVKKDGFIAKEYSLGGWKEQARRLKLENVPFKSENQVDIDACFWQPE